MPAAAVACGQRGVARRLSARRFPPPPAPLAPRSAPAMRWRSPPPRPTRPPATRHIPTSGDNEGKRGRGRDRRVAWAAKTHRPPRGRRPPPHDGHRRTCHCSAARRGGAVGQARSVGNHAPPSVPRLGARVAAPRARPPAVDTTPRNAKGGAGNLSRRTGRPKCPRGSTTLSKRRTLWGISRVLANLLSVCYAAALQICRARLPPSCLGPFPSPSPPHSPSGRPQPLPAGWLKKRRATPS